MSLQFSASSRWFCVVTWSRYREIQHAQSHFRGLNRSVKNVFLNRRRELEAGCFYSLSSLDGCLTFRIVLSSWHRFKALLIKRLAASDALAVRPVFNSLQSLVDVLDELCLTRG